MKKLIVIAIIGLFLGLTLLPSINANIEQNEYPNGNHLLKSEINEINQIMNDLRRDVESTEPDKVIDLYLDAIDELYEHGVLGYTPKQFIKAYMKMLNAVYSIIAESDYLHNILDNGNYDNVACSVVGKGNNLVPSKKRLNIYTPRLLFPLKMNSFISVGKYIGTNYYVWNEPTRGWVTTNGLMGNVSWESDTLYGNLSFYSKPSILGGPFHTFRGWYFGISRFSGIVIPWFDFSIPMSQSKVIGYYIGWALYVNIDEFPSHHYP